MGPNFQLSSASARGLPGFSTSSLFPSLRLQATRSLTVLLRPCLAGEGAVNPALSQESCRRPGRGGPGAAAALVPALVPGTFLSWSNPLTFCFLSVLCTFWSPIFINAGLLLAVPFQNRMGRCFTQVQGEVNSTPTYLAAIVSSDVSTLDIICLHPEVMTEDLAFLYFLSLCF